MQLSFDAPDETATDALGAALAAELPARALVTLKGALGAGKTRLVRALAAASGVAPERVVSPTFVLVQEYQGRRNIFHFDAYRLADDDEFLALGPDEYFAAEGVTLIEWAERVARCLPDELLAIEIVETGPSARRFTIRSRGARYEPVIARLASRLGVAAT